MNLETKFKYGYRRLTQEKAELLKEVERLREQIEKLEEEE